jgi:hypothetical protein
MPPRNPLQDPDVNNMDLFCYETMPGPDDLRPPTPPTPLAPTPLAPTPKTKARAGPQYSFTDPFLFCPCSPPCKIIDQVPCKHVCPDSPPGKHIKSKHRRAPASPAARQYRAGDDHWVQHIELWHPADFNKTRVEMDANLPMRAIFDELCSDARVQRKNVKFVWKRNRRRGGLQDVTLADTDAPWDVGMKQRIIENVICEFI